MVRCNMTAPAVCNPRATLRRMRIDVRLFAGLRELAGARAVEIELPEGATAGDVWPALALGDEPPGLLYRRQPGVRPARQRARRGRRGGADPARLRRRLPALRGAALARRRRARRSPSDDAGAIATFTGTTRAHSRGRDVIRLEYEAYEGMAEAEMERIAADLQERYSLLGVAIHHRVGVVEVGETSVVIAVSSAHRGRRARGLRGGDRHAQGHGAALEEGDLRGRRGMDRPGLVSELPPPRRTSCRRGPADTAAGAGSLAPIFVAGAVLLKIAGSLKFLGIFVALGGYALIWGWRFALGFVLLILVHELGHYVEARRQGLKPQLPGVHPVPRRLRRAARPAVRPVAQRARLGGRARSPAGIGALACLVYGNADRLPLLRALAYAASSSTSST